MTKSTLSVMVAVVISLVTMTEHSLAEEFLLEIIADESGDITNVRDGYQVDLEERPFERVEGFNLKLTRSLLFNEISYVHGGEVRSCCKRGGSWYLCPEEASRTLIGHTGEVVGEYVLVGGEWREVEYTDVEHTSAVIRRSEQKSHILAVVEKDSKLYGMLISAEGTIWYDPKEFTPTGD